MTAELTRRGSRADDLVQTRGRGGRAAKAASERTASGPPTGAQARSVAAGIREEPRVDLLPPEVKASRRHDAVARRLVLALGIVIVVVAAGIVACTLVAAQANASLSAAQAETQSLALEQQKYVGVKSIQNQIALTQAGQEVGASTEIDWTGFLGKVQGTIGGGLTLTGITIDSASPLAAYQQSSIPLQGARVATVTIDVKAASLDEVSAWLAQLAKLPAVTDVGPGGITLDESGYSASAVMHLDESAFDGRFAPKGK